MNNDLLNIDPALEKNKITSFIKTVLKKQGFKRVVIGMSGGVDSTTAFYLLEEIVAPQNIFVAHLYCQNSQFQDIEGIIKKAGIPKNNIYEMSIESFVKPFNVHLGRASPKAMPAARGVLTATFEVQKRTHLRPTSEVGLRLRHTSEVNPVNRIRLGNIMARIRMVILYDLAKKHNALVCGTENKSEFLLGYFTRFGDEASDFEPIQHLYKTQVYQLASFLKVPKNIIEKTPTAGLWHGQTDEKEFGFSYKEADQVLFYYYDKKLNLQGIKNKGFANADKIINFSLANSYKHRVPYALKKNV